MVLMESKCGFSMALLLFKSSSTALIDQMDLRAAEVLPAGKWVHVAASYNHNTGINSLYINGHLRASQNIGTGYEIATTSQKVRMGISVNNNRYFKGKIAKMLVYDVALNEAQIKASLVQGK